MVDFGSDVSLKKDILRKKEPFTRSWSEWSVVNRKQIIQDADSITTTVKTLHTVAKGEIFWLTNAHMNVSVQGLDDNVLADLSIHASSGQVIDIFKQDIRQTDGNVSQSMTESMSFVPPILLREGESIKFDFNEGLGSGRGHAFIVGWVEPKPIN